MSAGNGAGRTDRVIKALAEEAERYRPVLDHDRNLVQAIFIVQFRATGEVKRVILKPETHREVASTGPEWGQ